MGDAALKVETDEKAEADTEFGELTLSIATELKSQTDALNKEGTDLDTTTASAASDAKTAWETEVSDAKTNWETAVRDAKTAWETAQKKKTDLVTTTASAKKSLNKVLADATAAKNTAEGKAKEEKKEADAEFERLNKGALFSQTKAIKEICDGPWKIAQELKTTNDKANEESCEAEFNFLDDEKTMI